MSTPTYYKVLDASGRSCHGGTLAWSLPTWNGSRWKAGAWMPAIDGELVACTRGYHGCKNGTQLLSWLHDRIYVIESRSPWIGAGDKMVTAGPVRLTRGTAWDDRTARLFAVACALDVLPLYEAQYPDDPCVQDALIVAWKYANGHASVAAWAATRAAAKAAASVAANAAQGARLERYLVGDIDL